MLTCGSVVFEIQVKPIGEKFLEKNLNLPTFHRSAEEYLKAAKGTAIESEFKDLREWSSLILGDVEGKIPDKYADGMVFQ